MDRQIKNIVTEISKILDRQLGYKEFVAKNKKNADIIKINDYFAANLEYNKLQTRLIAGLIDMLAKKIN